jgi:ATP-dependent DNA helicase RecQ
VDVESVVRTTEREPYLERRIYQIGAVRCGADEIWVSGADRFVRWLELPMGEDWPIASPEVRERHRDAAMPAGQVLGDLLAFAEGADAIVAYNGTDADFPMLRDALAKEGLPDLPGARIDAFYLALALWPTAPSHRLAKLADEIGAVNAGLTWHDAADDAELLVRVLGEAARTLATWPGDLIDLIASVCPDSPSWRLLRELAGKTISKGRKRLFTHAEVADLTVGLLAAHPQRRVMGGDQVPGPGPARPVGELRVGAELTGTGGRVDPVALARCAHGADVRRRSAQDAMTAALHTWADAGESGAIEAPTGTGKSYAILAAVIDWLAADPTHTAIVTTYTKQLQAQLAADLTRLDNAVPWLLGVSDVVKGQANRLSLRALLLALADATALGDSARQHGTGTGRFVQEPQYRELIVYLFLRVRAASDPAHSWAARSVDPVDLPAFFTEYAPRSLRAWLNGLSQAEAGDYTADRAGPVSLHTDTVREALTSRRLILANHALLLAHLDQLEELGGDAILVVDEAHELESAATSALTTTLDYPAVEDFAAELRIWVREAPGDLARGSVHAAVTDLWAMLDHESIPKLTSQLFDLRAPGAKAGTRKISLAGPYGGSAGRGQVRTLAGQLVRLAGLCHRIAGALGAYREARDLDFYERERIAALMSRCRTQRDAAQTLVDDLDRLVGLRRLEDDLGKQLVLPDQEETTEDPADAGLIDDEPFDIESNLPEQPNSGASPLDPAGLEGQLGRADDRGELPAGTSNRLAHAEELDLPRGGLRRYRFRLAVSPIELPADADWNRFLGAFRRAYYVSATLRVEGEWSYLAARLGLAASTRTLHLPSPFDLANQIELVCMADFPSWAEQAEGAVRTVAHQLRGYSAVMISPATGERGGHDGGALVLTTSTSASGGIADRLTAELRATGADVPVRSALIRGNSLGVAEFSDAEYGGGFLIGTKGLWQGVDIADPERLRLVWINKLPFAPFGDPLIEARRAAEAARADALGVEDPERAANERYYLPLAALQLRQAVGRLIRSERHRGVVVISDRKLAGVSALRRSYRRIFLGSLDPEILRPDPLTWEPGGGNVEPMTEAWHRIWRFYERHGLLDAATAQALCSDDALDEHTVLPQTRAIRNLGLSRAETEELRASEQLADEVVRRSAAVAGLLRWQEGSVTLKPSQERAIRAVAEGSDLLALLPTGFGKSFCFQLPALVLPGVTLVVSPLVALMQDQALELNRSIGGSVRALIGPMRESNSRAGRTEVHDHLLGRRDNRIKIIYVSPERLCQSRFRALVREAVRAGIITRIAIDEAHTCVQWGDDFRPSFRRVERFLGELRAEFGLSVSALTATANQTVRQGLRRRIFGLDECDDGALVTVQENPIRPELAIHRRSIGAAGPAKVAALVEGVARELDGHAIFYCLTVREVTTVHAHLRDQLGDGRVLVRRFHGRLTEAEKAAVMAEFREAPRRGEEGFVPLLVVATSAFGLGVDRPDVRTVFCVSPPTDLAALYQQIGRAGRDGGAPGIVNAGLVLATNRGLRTVRFMTDRKLSASLARRMGGTVFGEGVLDVAAAADRLIREDLEAGRLDVAKARDLNTHDEYAEGVARVFATLIDLGAVEDLGDFPPRVAVLNGELTEPGGVPDAVEEKLIAAVLNLPAREGPLRRTSLALADLHRELSSEIEGYAEAVDHPVDLWYLLSDLHDRGRLDVSAAPSRRFVTGLRTIRRGLPNGFHAALEARTARAAAELEQLRDFFEDRGVCANRKFADYFGVADLPHGCCSGKDNRCSACWDRRTDVPRGEVRPAMGTALNVSVSRLAVTEDDGARDRRLEAQITALLKHVSAGLSAEHLRLALRGEDSWFHAGRRIRRRLPRTVTSSSVFGAAPRVTPRRVEAVLERLERENVVLLDKGRWREVDNVRREAARRTNGKP